MALVRSNQLDRIEDCLSESSALADTFASGGVGFTEAVGDWLGRLEPLAQESGLGVAPQLASLRVSLEAARQGVVAADLHLHGRLTPRKIRKATAQQALRSAISVVSGALQPFRSRQQHAEELAAEVASKSFEKGLWPGQGGSPGSPTDLPGMWRAALADPELAPRVRELCALLGMAEAMVAVAGAMNSFAGNGP